MERKLNHILMPYVCNVCTCVANEEKYEAVFHFHILLRLKVSIFLHATEIDVQGNVMFID